MTFNTASDRFLRISTIALFFLTLLVWIGPWLDKITEVQTALGRINNLSLLVAFIYLFSSLFIPPLIHSKNERRIAGSIAALIIYATVISFFRYADWIITFGGLLALFGALSAGFGAYYLAKSGKGLHTRLVALSLLTLPALVFAPSLIALNPEAYGKFWLNVYGYGNVRVFGYFAATTTVLLSGLVLASFKSGSKLIIAGHFVALSFSWSMLFWGGSRAGMVAVALSVIIGWAIIWRKPLLQVPFSIISMLSGLGLSMLYHIPDNAFGAINRVQVTVNKLASEGASSATSGRIDLWRWSWDRILEQPLLGRGYLPMADIKTEAFNFYHTHNIVLEYLLSFGFIAGGLALLLASAVWVRALIAARRIGEPVAFALLMLVIVLPIYAMFSATLFFPFHLMLFMISVGALIGWDVFLRLPVEEEVPFKADADWMFDDLKS